MAKAVIAKLTGYDCIIVVKVGDFLKIVLTQAILIPHIHIRLINAGPSDCPKPLSRPDKIS